MTEEKIKEMQKYDLETAMKRLDEVVDGLSREGMRLEDSLSLYEEGVALVKICNERLEDVERRISVLKMTSDGELISEPFDAEKGE